jgi:hypothetical protein
MENSFALNCNIMFRKINDRYSFSFVFLRENEGIENLLFIFSGY